MEIRAINSNQDNKSSNDGITLTQRSIYNIFQELENISKIKYKWQSYFEHRFKSGFYYRKFQFGRHRKWKEKVIVLVVNVSNMN